MKDDSFSSESDWEIFQQWQASLKNQAESGLVEISCPALEDVKEVGRVQGSLPRASKNEDPPISWEKEQQKMREKFYNRGQKGRR